MDFSKIKKLVNGNGDKFIMVENGEPELVVMSFQEYEKLVGLGAPHSFAGAAHGEGIEPAAAENQWLPAGLDPEAEGTPTSVFGGERGLPIRLEDIRLEDLPV